MSGWRSGGREEAHRKALRFYHETRTRQRGSAAQHPPRLFPQPPARQVSSRRRGPGQGSMTPPRGVWRPSQTQTRRTCTSVRANTPYGISGAASKAYRKWSSDPI